MSSHSLHIVFHGAEVLILKKSSLSIISFMDRVFGVVSAKPSPYPRSFRFSPVFSLSFFLFLKINLFIYFWLHWVFIAAHGHSLVVASGDYSSLWCAGFSFAVASLVVEHGL